MIPPNGFNPILIISGDYRNESINIDKTSGIYAISGLAPSNIKIPIYIGSSINLAKRIENHKTSLKANRHKNPPLQAYYNKYGIEKIVFYYIETCSDSELLKTEQKYIDFYGNISDRSSFNICSIAGNTLGVKKSEETREKIRSSLLGTEASLESKIKRSKSLKGKKRSLESRINLTVAKSKNFQITDPFGIIFTGKNLKEFSKQHGLTYTKMYLVNNGKIKSYRGWTRTTPLDKPIEQERYYKFLSPDGKIYEGNSITKFIKEIGFGRKQFPKLKKRIISEFRGWKNAS